jgi:energy-coupling factor transporter ATP-binding protein EcfA2
MKDTGEMARPEEVLAYWRNSLADAQKLGIDPKVLQDKARALELDQSLLANGRLDKQTVGLIKKKLETFRNEKSGEQAFRASVLLCPVALGFLEKHGTRGKVPDIVPLWVPAVVAGNDDGTGALLPADAAVPWIPRELLEPVQRHEASPTLGNVDDYDRFLSNEPPPGGQATWPQMWEWLNGLLESVTGQTLASFSLDGYVPKMRAGAAGRQGYLVLEEAPERGMTGALIQSYDWFLRRKSFPALLERIANLQPPSLRAVLEGKTFLRGTRNHLGQMGKDFPLSPSQRQALIHVCELRKGEILAVTGPPGTGKTTLLHSIIASMVVRHALEGKEPALILATSANNQAVTNIIDSFKASSNSPLACRWLPGIFSYGLYFPSAQKRAEAERKRGLQCIDAAGNGGFAGLVESPQYLPEAKATFLKRYEECFGIPPGDLNHAVQDIHQRLINLAGSIQRLPEVWLALTEALEALTELDGQIAKARESVRNAEQALQAWTNVLQAWLSHQARTPWWMGMFGFLPSVKSQSRSRAQGFAAIQRIEVDPEAGPEQVDCLIRNNFREWTQQADIHRSNVSKLENDIRQLKETIHDYTGDYVALLKSFGLPTQLLEPQQDELDKTARYKAFHLACHYWEGRWLMEQEKRIVAQSSWQPTAEGRMTRLRSLAMLAPCFVSTLFRVPVVMSVNGRRAAPYLDEGLDLLIVDEAGQVSPDVGGAVFGFAKKAVVVGDTLQIEPIWGVPTRIDLGNLKAAGIAIEEESYHFWASKGNLMAVAQRVSPFKACTEGGMFLTEHRRCVKSLISFCNELAYEGKLEPKREDPQKPGPIPIWGYSHISGRAERTNGSWGNTQEAEAIAQWIKEHERELVELDGRPEPGHGLSRNLGHIVAVITPFARQKKLIDDELRKRNIDGITVGTVHALQGSERPVVIFSPTCTRHEPRPYFFDRGVNMLNVAVSRAKDSFLVFGDMYIFDGHDQKSQQTVPSLLLGRFLLRKDENELPGCWFPKPSSFQEALKAQPLLIRDLKAHREVLSECLSVAKERVIIVSPWISAYPLEADGLCQKISHAVGRGVRVLVLADRCKNSEDGEDIKGPLKANAKKAASLLSDAGAELVWLRLIHDKEVFVDRSLMIIGSFNWLSASRSRTGQFEESNASWRLEGEEASKCIQTSLDSLKTHAAFRPLPF